MTGWTIAAYHLCTYTWALAYIAIIYRGFSRRVIERKYSAFPTAVSSA